MDILKLGFEYKKSVNNLKSRNVVKQIATLKHTMEKQQVVVAYESFNKFFNDGNELCFVDLVNYESWLGENGDAN